MDPALQAMMAGQGAGGGNMRLFGFFPDIDSSGFETLLPIGQLTLDELLKKLLPFMHQALVFNFPGGFLWKTFFQKILEMLKQQIDNTAHGISGGHDVGHASGPSAGGDHSKSSGISYDH